MAIGGICHLRRSHEGLGCAVARGNPGAARGRGRRPPTPSSFPRKREPRGARGAGDTSVVPAKAGTQGARGAGRIHLHLRRSREGLGCAVARGNPGGHGAPAAPPSFPRKREPRGRGAPAASTYTSVVPAKAGTQGARGGVHLHLRRSREGLGCAVARGNPRGAGRRPHPPTPPSFPRKRELRGRGAPAAPPSFQRKREPRGARGAGGIHLHLRRSRESGNPGGRGARATPPSFPRKRGPRGRGAIW